MIRVMPMMMMMDDDGETVMKDDVCDFSHCIASHCIAEVTIEAI